MAVVSEPGLWAVGRRRSQVGRCRPPTPRTSICPIWTARSSTSASLRGQKVLIVSWAPTEAVAGPAGAGTEGAAASPGFEVVRCLPGDGGPRRGPSFRGGSRFHLPSLIDRTHYMDARFGVTTSPQSIWIDENSTIVRPPEPASPCRSVSGVQMAQLVGRAGERSATWRWCRIGWTRAPTALRAIPARSSSVAGPPSSHIRGGRPLRAGAVPVAARGVLRAGHRPLQRRP